MAAIDKLYCYSKKDFIIFYQWCIKFDHMCQKETQKSIMDFLYTDLEHYDTTFSSYVFGVPVANFPNSIDMWLLRHCPVEWVRSRLREQHSSYRLKPRDIALYLDCGKA
ncbi:hypothetical protein [Bacteroides oleiciplenus]|uniref:Uncharacterized protein n=1 Tax=Bacteroides oleiciplenus YIT 12058 TaxID=742727 RepID=K9E686_9BACE|nr:hypothetical protein [Bacteroides oleiciplenus]EKU92173.1 hypothetical protein HMPREF9447_00623 [Bacteroides oleiciplenus YIT 12058]